MFAAGEPPPPLAGLLDEATFATARVVCADGGLSNCLKAGRIPDCLIGDFDSVDAESSAHPSLAAVPRIVHPVDKSASDLELALEYLANDPQVPDVVVMLGVSGGRSDHHLFNWLLPMLRSWPFGLRLIDRTVDAYLVTPARPCDIPCETDDTISLVPLGDVAGVTTEGLVYRLHDDDLQAGRTLGLSNLADASRVHVEIRDGRLLVMRVLS